MSNIGDPTYLQSQLNQYAGKYNIDPAAALAVAQVEGAGGGIGDNGTSFGPWQLHIGGALPDWVGQVGGDFANTWAWSTDGITYALSKMQESGAGGKTGKDAVIAIVQNFERPADPATEIKRALAVLGLPIGPGPQSPSDPGVPGSPPPVNIPPPFGGSGSTAPDTCTAPSVPFGLNPADWLSGKSSGNPGPTVSYYACVIAHDVQRVLIGIVAIVIVVLGIWIFSQDKDAPDAVKQPVQLARKGGKAAVEAAAEAAAAA